MASPEQEGESAAGAPHSTPVPEEMDFDLFERFQETFLDALKVHLRIFSISKCTCFGDEDSFKNPTRFTL